MTTYAFVDFWCKDIVPYVLDSQFILNLVRRT